MVGGRRAAVAADEAHHRPAGALVGVEEEVADDHPEVVEVEVQCLDVLGGLQHDMSEPLNACRHPGRALRRVGAVELVTDVEDVWLLVHQLGQLVHACHHADGETARVDEVDADPSDRLGQRFGGCTRDVGQPKHVGVVSGPERCPDEP